MPLHALERADIDTQTSNVWDLLSSADRQRIAKQHDFPTLLQECRTHLKNGNRASALSQKSFEEIMVPLAHYALSKANGKHPFVLGIVGGPGAGKTTLSYSVAYLVEKMGGLKTMVAALEDFYFDPQERKQRGVPHRAMVGSHDLPRLAEFLKAIQAREPTIRVPRYDMASDAPSSPQTIEGPIDVLVFEGWLLGHRGNGYDVVAQALDHMVFLDCAVNDLRQWRFEREERIRAAGDGKGFSKEYMQVFWDEVFANTLPSEMQEVKPQADVVLTLSAQRHVLGVQLQNVYKEIETKGI